MYLHGKPHVMVVDDDPGMCAFLESFLAQRGYHAFTVANAQDAVKHYETARPSAVILDMVSPDDIAGLTALSALKTIDGDIPIIVLSDQTRATAVVQAMKLGASDFLRKPFAEADLEGPLANALRQHQLSREAAARKDHPATAPTAEGRMLFGDSKRMAEVRDVVGRIADTDVTVLIRGESGTGKELLARTLCSLSPRRDQPFVKVHCGSLPGELLESELFGVEGGASAGAVQDKPRSFEVVRQGTMFLDEIEDMSDPLQSRLMQLLHALQDGELSRSAVKPHAHPGVRVIAATTRDLERAVADGRFREDLFFRLNVVCINLPPLRERREDVPGLVDYFLTKYSAQYNKPSVAVSADTMRLMTDYEWPGNILELENLMKRAVLLGSEVSIRTEVVHGTAMAGQRASALGTRPATASRSPAEAPMAVPLADIAFASTKAGPYSLKDISRTAAREAERVLIGRMLEHTRWNRKETAEILGISYKALLYKMKENGLERLPK